MKPLPSAPLTVEDHAAWVGVCCRWRGTPQPMSAAGRADRRDAELMSWLSLFGHRHYGRMPSMPKAAQLPVVHLWLRIDPEWPAGHHIIDLT